VLLTVFHLGKVAKNNDQIFIVSKNHFFLIKNRKMFTHDKNQSFLLFFKKTFGKNKKWSNAGGE